MPTGRPTCRYMVTGMRAEGSLQTESERKKELRLYSNILRFIELKVKFRMKQYPQQLFIYLKNIFHVTFVSIRWARRIICEDRFQSAEVEKVLK